MEKEAEARRSAIVEEQQKLAQAAKARAEDEARKRAEAEAAPRKQRRWMQYMRSASGRRSAASVVLPPGMDRQSGGGVQRDAAAGRRSARHQSW